MTDEEALDFVKTIKAEILGKEVKFHLIFNDEPTWPSYYNFFVEIPDVKNTVEPDKVASISMKRVLSKSYDLSQDLISQVFRELLHNILKHEADEAFQAGSVRPFFPHPEFSWPCINRLEAK